MEQPLHERPCQSPCRGDGGEDGWGSMDTDTDMDASGQLSCLLEYSTRRIPRQIPSGSEQNPSSDNQLAGYPFLLLFCFFSTACFVLFYLSVYHTSADGGGPLRSRKGQERNEQQDVCRFVMPCVCCADRSHRPRVQLQQQTLGICLNLHIPHVQRQTDLERTATGISRWRCYCGWIEN